VSRVLAVAVTVTEGGESVHAQEVPELGGAGAADQLAAAVREAREQRDGEGRSS